MKTILDAPFLTEMRKTTANMYRLGWDERNGGNISCLLDEKEATEFLDVNHVIREIPIGFEAQPLALSKSPRMARRPSSSGATRTAASSPANCPPT